MGTRPARTHCGFLQWITTEFVQVTITIPQFNGQYHIIKIGTKHIAQRLWNTEKTEVAP